MTVKLQKVKMISERQLKLLIRSKKVELMHVSDDGEYMRVGIKQGESITHVMGFWTADLGEDTLVVDYPNIITKQSYDQRKILFEEEAHEEVGPAKDN